MKTIYYTLILAIVVFSSACSNKKEPVQKENLRPVKYAEISYSGIGQVRSFNGTARSDKEINLSFRTSGILTILNISAGQKVKKGELLAQIDNSEARLSLEQSISSLNSAKANLNTSTSTLSRTKTLFEKGSASLSDYENAKSSFASAKADFESKKRTVEIQKKQVGYGIIYAPANGIIASKNVENNENVGSGSVIAVLNAGSFMEISLGMPENVINRVHKGMKVIAKFPALQGKKFEGVVDEIAPSIESGSATYPVRVKLLGKNTEVKSGMAANITFNFPKTDNQEVLIVPISAVGEDSKGNFVYLIEKQSEKIGLIKKQHFTIGELSPIGFEVVKGLKPGQIVATAGLQTLLDGQKVSLK
ncbi:efflux RND transporter periplasmic adaptor subunit [Ancylomarina sp. DW003]|uniref:Efflux RND transporter periplasmic adaptor subunit n=1 Tax=Paralabilibaculum antarcticum TaxID=2912572 RepID=A0ABT5VRL3_9BACT|nr:MULTISPECIES: efflux RND transporter periplasmic adaptor subunit [Marinifilaceae]MDE5417163.1 efflux RND transporter periplasmic adaptor subunit [Labilibaculum sp. DW002]MDE5424212.1 efflux RND transporter periplasmic adaptor subunit [Ancylomarina sp. DW003]